MGVYKEFYQETKYHRTKGVYIKIVISGIKTFEESQEFVDYLKNQKEKVKLVNRETATIEIERTEEGELEVTVREGFGKHNWDLHELATRLIS